MEVGGDINLFRVPHARMKELISQHLSHVAELKSFYVAQLENGADRTDAADNKNEARALTTSLENFLQALYEAMWEMKSHEYIENTFIMDKLKQRLHQKQIYNELVCNCHEDSKLLDVISLIEKVYSATDQDESNSLGKQLQEAIGAFLGEFIDHMEEEESIFTPLLAQNFATSELRDMESVVLRQHSLFRAKVRSEKCLRDAASIKRKLINATKEDEASEAKRALDSFQYSIGSIKFQKSYCEEVAARLAANPSLKTDTSVIVKNGKNHSAFSQPFPAEILLSIFSHLDSPRDLMNISSVCREWRRLAFQPSLWPSVLPNEWWMGLWSFDYVHPTKIGALKRDQKSHGGRYDVTNFGSRLAGFHHSATLPSLSSSQSSSSASSAENLVTAVVAEDINNAADNSRSKSPRLPRKLQLHSFLDAISSTLLPAIGTGVTEFRATCNKYISDSHLTNMLSNCTNLVNLDLSHTAITGDCLSQLVIGCEEESNLRSTGWACNLEYISFAGCQRLTDEGLASLVRLGISSNLKSLNLSGCASLTGRGIGQLLKIREQLSNLTDLDLSGICTVDGPILREVVDKTPNLMPSGLSYCNDIEDGPWPSQANGCQNLDCQTLFCCKSSIVV